MALSCNKKECLVHLFQTFGLLTIKSALKRRQSFLPILAYHRVCPIPTSDYPFDKEVISASTEIFDEQVALIKKAFDPITFALLKNAIEGETPLPDRPLIITFDDGYVDNYRNALPVLKSYHLPATFFIATDYIGTANLFWWEKIVFWIKRGEIPQILNTINLPMNGTDLAPKVIRKLKGLDDTRRMTILEAWEKEYPLALNENEVAAIRPCTWDEIREMSRAGMEIGSHTKTHPVLSQCSPQVLDDELTGSKQKIELEISQAVVAIAYPGGKSTDHDARVHQAAEKAGYIFGLAYDGGVNALASLSHYNLKRLAVEHRASHSFFKSHLFFPNLFSYRWGA